MKLYRAVIRPVSSFSSALQSDTFFGAFCWSYRYCFGEDALEALLEEMKQNKPEIIFSNAFPHDTLPLPLGIRDTAVDYRAMEKKEERRNAYQNRKKLKAARFVERKWFEKIIRGEFNGFTAGLTDDGIREQTVIHNMVSRKAGTVTRTENSGNLYTEDEAFAEAGQTYDLYILSSLEFPVLEEVLKIMCMLGIGKNKSTGKGAFTLVSLDEDELNTYGENANAYLALSNFVPAAEDPTEGWYKTFVKYGKLDREYADTEIPFKKPVLFVQAGALFKGRDIRPYYGRCVANISARDGVVTNGYTIAVPMHV